MTKKTVRMIVSREVDLLIEKKYNNVVVEGYIGDGGLYLSILRLAHTGKNQGKPGQQLGCYLNKKDLENALEALSPKKPK